ncbi:MAG: RNA polymerase sigma factor [Pseudomonadota bacterium]
MGDPGNKADIGLAIYIEERERLCMLARSVVGNTAIAEELVQDSWLRWSAHHYDASHARSILRRIVVNLARDWWRRQKAERFAFDALRDQREMAPTTERAVIARDDLARVIATLERMSERHRTAFELSWMHELSCSEIGARLGISKSRAHQLIRQTLVEIAIAIGD